MRPIKKKSGISALQAAFLIILCTACCYSHAQKESLTIGPADMLHIKVLEASELEQTARVNDDGQVPLILGGNVAVGNLTPSAAARAIERVLVSGHYLLTPHVSVEVQQYATENVTIMGQVHLPGNYPIGTPRSIVDVLALAGGLTDLADKKITIERQATKQHIEYVVANSAKDALDASVDIFPGDTIVVPKADVVYILGDVNRPGGIAMVTNDSKLSAIQALTIAGGTPPNAVPSRARLIRKQADGSRVEIPLQLSAMQKGKKPDMQLQADDIVYVPFSYARNIAVGAGSLVGATSSAAIYRF